MWAAYIADKEFLVEMLGDSEYQRWYDESAHPLRRQQRRPGGLEAAWAAVLETIANSDVTFRTGKKK